MLDVFSPLLSLKSSSQSVDYSFVPTPLPEPHQSERVVEPSAASASNREVIGPAHSLARGLVTALVVLAAVILAVLIYTNGLDLWR